MDSRGFLTFLFLATASSLTRAQGEEWNLTITTKEASNLYIDGVYTNLPYSRNFSVPDTIKVTSSTRLVALQAINILTGCPGVLASATDDYILTNRTWKCSEASGGNDWMEVGFNDNGWLAAVELKQNLPGLPDCEPLPYISEISTNAWWIWVENAVTEVIYCRGYFPVCDSFPCLNGATCEVNNPDLCTCAAGYTGSVCETEINECDSRPCLNGGTCNDFVNDYECTCIPGYTGKVCQTEIDECVSEPCLSGATCEDLLSGYRCHCPVDFTGATCETKIDDCLSQPCNNAGTCIPGAEDGYYCNCEPDFTGTHCETFANDYLTFVVTADRSLVDLYVDGERQVLNLTLSTNWEYPEFINVSTSAKLIAIRASNAFPMNCSGILASINNYFVTDSTWKCSSDATDGWFNPGFDDSDWPSAIEYDKNVVELDRCSRFYLKDISSRSYWIWSVNQTDPVNCRAYLPSSGESRNQETKTQDT